MRILTVCTSTEMFGAEIATLNILRAFQSRGHPQLAVTSSWTDGKFSKCLADLGIPELPIPLGVLSKKLSAEALWWTFNATIRSPKLWLEWHRALRRFDPDVVLLTNPKQGLWFYPWLGMRKAFLFEHSMKSLSPSNRWMYKVLQEELWGFAAISQFMAQHLRDLGISADNIRVIYNYCPIDEATVTFPQKLTSTSPVRIGIAGQISSHKGHSLLLDAAILLKRRGTKFEVLVFGSGPAGYIADLRRRLELESLTQQWKWLGYATDREEMYRSMDICVVPSQFDEPFGMVALEALSHAIPVIAARRGGLPEIVTHTQTGLLFDSQDPADLAEKIDQLVSNWEFARELGRNGQRRSATEFTPERTVSAYESMFRDGH